MQIHKIVKIKPVEVVKKHEEVKIPVIKKHNFNNKIDLSDVSFHIPLKFESADRIRNLKIVINYLLKNFNTNITICEESILSKYAEVKEEHWQDKVVYFHMHNHTEYFNKTKCLNMMARRTKAPIIISHDSDVVFYPSQYLNAITKIRNNVADFVYPFNQPNHNITKGELLNEFEKTLDLTSIDAQLKFEHPTPPPGGCFIMKKSCFIEAGMENENFKAWGPEDVERRDRFSILGYRVQTVPGKLFHLDHERTINSTHKNIHFSKNEEEYKKILSMNREKLKQYIKTWSWL